MTLYHGSNSNIDSIDLTRSMRYKDFGKGFYLTPDRKTAVRMAQKKAKLFGGTPTLITYELDESALTSFLKVKHFPETACVASGRNYCRCGYTWDVEEYSVCGYSTHCSRSAMSAFPA